MRKELDYNEFGPETCLTDELFLLLWKYYETHEIPDKGAGHTLINIFDIREQKHLNEAMFLDINKISEKEIVLLADRFDYSLSGFKASLREGFVFWTSSSYGSWKAERFATEDRSSNYTSVENLKHTIKELAIEEGLLSGYEDVGTSI